MIDLVERVEFRMNDSWGLKDPIIKRFPNQVTEELSIKYDGWGWFSLPITIVFKKEHKLENKTIYHDLYFEDNGRVNTHKFDCAIKQKVLYRPPVPMKKIQAKPV